MSPRRRTKGRIVVSILVGLCILGCLGTIRNYRALHETTDSVRWDQSGTALVGTFRDPSRLATGQKATVSFLSDPSKKFVARVIEVRGNEAVVSLSDTLPDVGAPARITVDTTVLP